MLIAMRRLGYAVFFIVLVGLSAMFGLRLYDNQDRALPRVDAPPEIKGLSCEDGISRARDLTKNDTLESARLAYLWLIASCEGSSILPDALIEAGSLSGYLLHRPAEARQVYKQFLLRFPTHPQADDATYHLAKLDIDAGDYPSAVAHLTLLAQDYPQSTHHESAQFLVAKASEMLAADRSSLWTVVGQLRKMVPNNILSLLAVLAAVGPAALQIFEKAGDSGSNRRRLVPVLILVLTLLNYFVNNFQSDRQNKRLMAKLDRLAVTKN